MADLPDGLDLLKGRIERRSRAVPPPRRPRSAVAAPDVPAVTPPAVLEETAGAIPTIEDGPEPAGTVDQVVQPRSDRGLNEDRPAAPAAKPSTQDSKAPAMKAATQAVPPDEHPATYPDEPLANLMIRVRRSLDERLADLVHELKRHGVRTSKAELVEMLLWDLPAHPTGDLRTRLGIFRQLAPREEQL
ncbi:MAG: hypothetical protein ACYDAG_01655 [Chloroflexota bacterium]